VVSEAWMLKNHEIQRRIMPNYQNGSIGKLPIDEKIEILTFIVETKNSINHGSNKSELYEIMREKHNDESSRVLELKNVSDTLIYNPPLLII
jgi:hypothetical protein